MWYLKGGMSPLVQGGRIPLWNGVNKDEVLSVLKEKAQGSIDMDSMENYLSLDTRRVLPLLKDMLPLKSVLPGSKSLMLCAMENSL